MDEPTNAQQVVVYTGTDGKPVVYDTVYDHDQARSQVKRCTERHGTDANCRLRDAREAVR